MSAVINKFFYGEIEFSAKDDAGSFKNRTANGLSWAIQRMIAITLIYITTVITFGVQILPISLSVLYRLVQRLIPSVLLCLIFNVTPVHNRYHDRLQEQECLPFAPGSDR